MRMSRSLILVLSAACPLTAFAQSTAPVRPTQPGRMPDIHDPSAAKPTDPQLKQKLQVLQQLEGIWQVELTMNPAAGNAAGGPAYRGTATDAWILDHAFIQELHIQSLARNLGIEEPVIDEHPGEPGLKHNEMDPMRDPAAPGNPGDPAREPGQKNPARAADQPSVAFSTLPGMAFFGYDQAKSKYTATWLDARTGQVNVHYGDWNPGDKTIVFSSADPANAGNPTTPAGRSGDQYTVTLKIVSDQERTIETRHSSSAGQENQGEDNILYRVRYTKSGDSLTPTARP
jgi:hypothetical protein